MQNATSKSGYHIKHQSKVQPIYGLILPWQKISQAHFILVLNSDLGIKHLLRSR
jgi:hypothetical protein